jgi:hypothetical protein
MSRQTLSAVRKRIELLRAMHHLIDHIEDDEQVRRICSSIFVFQGYSGLDALARRIRGDVRAMNLGIDLDNPANIKVLKLAMKNHAVEVISDPAKFRLPTGHETASATKAAAKRVLRAFRMRLRRQDGLAANLADARTAIKARRDYPDLYNGKTDKQIIKQLTR